MKRFIVILALCGQIGMLGAQEPEPRTNTFLMFLHAGYGNLPSKTLGLTNRSADYTKKLQSGASWNAQLYFKHKMLIVGMMYSGYTSKGALEHSSDRLLSNYIAPQIGMHIPTGKIFSLGWNVGFGGLIYNNNSTVYEKPRELKGSALGANLGVRGIFNITPNFGVSVEIMSILASLNKTHNNYHDEIIEVIYIPSLSMHQFTFSLGFKYSL